MSRQARSVGLVVLTGLVAACGGGDDGGSDSERAGEVTVFAAASLTAAFGAIAEAFEVANRGVAVTLNFASSSDLAAQIEQGAPADVFASADQANMDKVVDDPGTVGEPRPFATNELQIIVGSGNPKGIESLSDLAGDGLIFVTTAPEVPIGRYTEQVLAAAGVEVSPASLEENVKAIVTKVTLGEADAGIVYRTDVFAAGDDAAGIDIPDDVNVTARYPIAVPADALDPVLAAAFVDFVVSAEGLAILERYGFGAP